ncbi:MAG: TetR/AcrR family transcriptional regulator [Porphyromonadaceae bacterium]|nr:TetR/AcrR family transcriptional regulator [Porphyromonadaceae bacterium]
MNKLMSKTRKILVDAAQKLFAQKGIDNTTMNNIALASGKGRRTLYTYFRSKADVYQAVIESELSHLILKLHDVVGRDLSPDEKLAAYVQVRFDVFREIVLRNGTLKAEFFRDIRKVETARKNIDKQEVEFLRNIIDDGISKGIFRPIPVQPTCWVIHCCLKGLEIPYLKGIFANMGVDSRKLKDFISDLAKSYLGRERLVME